jgi:dATP pyrophosphohydrolase
VEVGETLREAALRELKEETGVILSDQELHETGFTFDFEGRWGKAQETVFFCILAAKPKILIDPSEHQDYCWVPIEQVEQRIHYASNKEAFSRIRRMYESASTSRD